MNGTPTNLKQSQVQRVLIYRIGSLGDTLVSLPAFHLIARTFPNAERRLLTNFPVNVKAPPAAAILENTDLVHGYFRYTVGTRNPADLPRLWWTLSAGVPMSSSILVRLAESSPPIATKDFFDSAESSVASAFLLTKTCSKIDGMRKHESLEPEADAPLPQYLCVRGWSDRRSCKLGSPPDTTGICSRG